ncbi:MAG: hypothetical protein FWD78_13525 [Treponema sp.]|nr:hypothetical protein [Treponema sp.]
MEIKEYKCPNCAGAVKFDSSSQNMKCPYCGAEFEVKILEEYQKELTVPDQDNFNWNQQGLQAMNSGELEDLGAGSCPSCGAELIGDKNTAAMVCPNCGNTQIVMQRLSGMLKPNYLIPFKLEKKDAVAALKDFYKGKRLLPNSFKDENRVNSIQGVYLPFWLFNAKTSGYIRFRAAKTKTWSDSSYNYTKTDYYSVVREGSLNFEKVPVDGSQRMDDSYMDAIEPFDYGQIKDFGTAYLSGYLAEKYDVDADASKTRAGARMKASLEEEFTKSVKGYTTVKIENSRINVEDGKINYSLLPAWVLNTKYKRGEYLFIMNGQTGRLVGRLPADRGKFWKYTLMFTGIMGLAFTALIVLLRIFI